MRSVQKNAWHMQVCRLHSERDATLNNMQYQYNSQQPQNKQGRKTHT